MIGEACAWGACEYAKQIPLAPGRENWWESTSMIHRFAAANNGESNADVTFPEYLNYPGAYAGEYARHACLQL